MAHELAHVVQGPQPHAAETSLTTPTEPAEAEAVETAEAVLGGGARVHAPTRGRRHGAIARTPAPPGGAAAPARLDRSKAGIDEIADIVVWTVGGAPSFPTVAVHPAVADPSIVHISWELYDPSDRLMSGSFTALPGRADAKTAPFAIGPTTFKPAAQGRYSLRLIGLDASHSPVAYSDRTFFVWLTAPASSLALPGVKGVTKSPATHTLGEVGAARASEMALEHKAAVASKGTGLYMGTDPRAGAQPPGVAREDCTTYVLEVLKYAFAAKGQQAKWQAIYDEAVRTSHGAFKGTELLKALESKAGWKGIFWSPDPRNPQDARSEHPVAYQTAQRQGTYYGIGVEKGASVVDYRRTSPTQPEQFGNLDKLRGIPLGVIAARGGWHMTLLLNGQVYEVHWDKPPTDPNVIEATPLEKWIWQSGVVLVPAEDFNRTFGSNP